MSCLSNELSVTGLWTKVYARRMSVGVGGRERWADQAMMGIGKRGGLMLAVALERALHVGVYPFRKS